MTSTQFEQLLREHGDSVFGFCCHLTENLHTAEDLYQEAILKAFGQLEKIDCERSDGFMTARNYIIGIAIKLYKNYSRKKSNKSGFFLNSDDAIMNSLSDSTDIVGDLEQKELLKSVRRIVGELPEKLRIVTYMFYYLDMSVNDISAELDIPLGTVKSRMNRSRKQIKKELEEIDCEKSGQSYQGLIAGRAESRF